MSSHSSGILLVELGVGITVAAAMITIFCTFAGRVEVKEDAREEAGLDEKDGA